MNEVGGGRCCPAGRPGRPGAPFGEPKNHQKPLFSLSFEAFPSQNGTQTKTRSEAVLEAGLAFGAGLAVMNRKAQMKTNENK